MKTKTNSKLILISVVSSIILGASSFFIFHIAYAVSSYTINLSWTASTDNVAVTGYKIYRDGVQIGTSPTNSYSDKGLNLSTTYSYTVSAYDAADNNSIQSTSFSVTTPSIAKTQTSGGRRSVSSVGVPNISNNNSNEPPSIITSPLIIPGCNVATGFSKVTGASCINNTGGDTTVTTYNFDLTTLRYWNNGEPVKELQRFLNAKLNLGLIVDGILGPKTTIVIKKYQKDNGLVVDGIVGPKTKQKMMEK